MPVERIMPSATFLGFLWDSFLTANMTIVSHSKVTLLLFCLYYFCVIITTHPCRLCWFIRLYDAVPLEARLLKFTSQSLTSATQQAKHGGLLCSVKANQGNLRRLQKSGALVLLFSHFFESSDSIGQISLKRGCNLIKTQLTAPVWSKTKLIMCLCSASISW